MTDPEYAKALRLGEKAFKAAQAKGEYPYLPALDEFLSTAQIQTETELGLVDIPLEQIVGTKTAGRQNSFACNFMPLLKENTEFASKWSNVFKYQMNEGVNDPIIAYEFMNKYYVLEGNKRVSVLKFLGAFSIEGMVTRIVPRMSTDPQVHIFYEYMEFYRRTAINYVWFSKEGSFAALIKACGMGADEMWSEQARSDFSSRYLRFVKAYEEKGGKKLSITAGDAFLFYLQVYPYEALEEKSVSQIKAELEKLWKEFAVLEKEPDEALVLQPGEGPEAGIFTRFFSGTGSKQLKIAFLHDKPAKESGWVYSHELGRMHLEQVFGGRVKTEGYFQEIQDADALPMIEAAIEDGNHIIFTTSERMLSASLKAALAHPEIKILNCSVNRPYQALRTYYGRMYEAKFLGGMIAGAMCGNDRIAYAADYPIYGALANVNAFARGARMTNPRARVFLHWNCVPGANLEDLMREHEISIVSDVDMSKPEAKSRRFGLYQIEDGICRNLAAPMWNWGKFYEKIIRDIVSGSWSGEARSKRALNYWWGISGDIIDLIMSQRLPEGIRTLTGILREQIYQGIFHPFQGVIRRQDGSQTGTAQGVLSSEEIITMDWLCENVIGRIPTLDQLSDSARKLAEVQGISALREAKGLGAQGR